MVAGKRYQKFPVALVQLKPLINDYSIKRFLPVLFAIPHRQCSWKLQTRPHTAGFSCSLGSKVALDDITSLLRINYWLDQRLVVQYTAIHSDRPLTWKVWCPEEPRAKWFLVCKRPCSKFAFLIAPSHWQHFVAQVYRRTGNSPSHKLPSLSADFRVHVSLCFRLPSSFPYRQKIISVQDLERQWYDQHVLNREWLMITLHGAECHLWNWATEWSESDQNFKGCLIVMRDNTKLLSMSSELSCFDREWCLDLSSHRYRQNCTNKDAPTGWDFGSCN